MSVNTSSHTERRIVFLIIFLAVMVPLIFPIGWGSEVSPIARMSYDLIDETPAGKYGLISFDYEASTITELQPMAVAQIEHAWSKGQKIIATALWPQGPQMAEASFAEAKRNPAYADKEYGVDYVNLGYKVGGIVTLQAMGSSIRDVYPKDSSGKNWDDLPMLKGIRTLKDLAWVSSLSSGVPGLKEWVMIAHDVHNVPVTGGTTAVSAPGFLPYVNDQKQLHGLLGGLKAASEYEMLIDKKGPATTKMDAQSVAHIVILLLITLGNITAFRRKRAKANLTGGQNA
ncbi:MAG: hypothetical protein GX122_02690 [Candidatus Cloacimonetes bacterium]|nr:hypothetical protein [Candidatus Cloacimonadota bacterium]NLK50076.1 hypothetical protein [Candidatus Cloacimonadota bacterium]NLO11310.1 hypothetical protein [Candidatus Cloacimonadota bacterium]